MPHPRVTSLPAAQSSALADAGISGAATDFSLLLALTGRNFPHDLAWVLLTEPAVTHQLTSPCAKATELLQRRTFDLTVIGPCGMDDAWFDHAVRILESAVTRSILFVTDRKEPGVERAMRLSDRVSVFEALTESTENFGVALRTTAAGRRYVSPALATLLHDPEWRQIRSIITPREERILAVLGTGCSHHEAARLLGMKHETVRWHKTKIARTFDLHRREQLQAFALR